MAASQWGQRRSRRADSARATEQHKLILFAYHLGNGVEPIQAFMAAGLWSRNETDADYGEASPAREDEIAGSVEQAEELAQSSVVQTLMRLVKTDARKLLQSGLSMAVLKLMSLAFTSQSERVQLVAIKEWMSRGGLPAETKMLGPGEGRELENLTDAELLGQLKDLFTAWDGAKKLEQLDG